jgi:hypothetical protein
MAQNDFEMRPTISFADGAKATVPVYMGAEGESSDDTSAALLGAAAIIEATLKDDSDEGLHHRLSLPELVHHVGKIVSAGNKKGLQTLIIHDKTGADSVTILPEYTGVHLLDGRQYEVASGLVLRMLTFWEREVGPQGWRKLGGLPMRFLRHGSNFLRG